MRKFLLVTATVCLVFARIALGEATLPFEIQSALITKILMYDNNVDRNVKNNVITIGVVYNNDDKSKAVLKTVTSEFSKLKAKGVKIKNCTLDVVSIGAGGDLADELRAKNVNVVYIVDSRNADIESIVGATQSQKILTIVGDDTDRSVSKGVSVGLKNENDKPSILMNIQSAMKEGRDFSAQFLSLVKIVK